MIYKFVAFLLSIVCSISRQHLFSVNCVEDKMEHYCVLYVCRVKHVMYTQAHVARVRKLIVLTGLQCFSWQLCLMCSAVIVSVVL